MKSPVFWFVLLSVALLIVSAISLGVGVVAISPSQVIRTLTSVSDSETNSIHETIIFELRMPRILLACLVGAGLGTAGAGYQGLFRNPLADPFVIGASSGAALGGTLVIVSGLDVRLLGVAAVPCAALLGSLLAVALVYAIASVGRQVPLLSLLLAGVATSSFLGAVVSLLMFLNDEQLVTIFAWLMGSLSGRNWATVRMAAPLIMIGSCGLWTLSRSLDALTFGEETAASMGIRLRWLRALVILTASLTTAAAVAASGVIGFVGLIAPHLARLLVGARHAAAIPASGLVGAIILVLADDVARVVAAPAELPVGIVTALLGSPFFLLVLKMKQRDLRGTP
jgi:iron complex transport system permease protein